MGRTITPPVEMHADAYFANIHSCRSFMGVQVFYYHGILQMMKNPGSPTASGLAHRHYGNRLEAKALRHCPFYYQSPIQMFAALGC